MLDRSGMNRTASKLFRAKCALAEFGLVILFFFFLPPPSSPPHLFLFSSLFLSLSLSLSLLFPCPSKLLLHVRRSFRHAFRLSYRENIPIGRTSNKRVLSSPRIYSRIYFTVIEGIQSSSARRSDAWVGRVSSLPREIRRPIDIRPT